MEAEEQKEAMTGHTKSWADIWRESGRLRLGGTSESKIEQTELASGAGVIAVRSDGER